MSDIEHTNWSETAASNNAAVPNGAPEGWNPSTVNNVLREVMRAVKSDWNRRGPTLTSGGSANAQTLTPTSAVASLVRGQVYSFIAGFTNTGATTLAISGLAATAVRFANAALRGGEIVAGQICEVQYDGTAYQITSPITSISGRDNVNPIVNADSAVAQLGGAATAAADNSYAGDGLRVLSEANGDSNWFQATSSGQIAAGAKYGDQFQVAVINKKFGGMRPIEGKDIWWLVGQPVIFSATIYASASLGNIKMGIMQFVGTEDAISGDPISAWNADGTTPTLAANWSFVNTPANMSATTTPTKMSVTGTVSASATNLAVMIWNDDKTTTLNDVITISQWDLRRGSVGLPFEPVDIQRNLARCQRYFWKSFPQGTAPADNAGSAGSIGGTVVTAGATSQRLFFRRPVTMRTKPTNTYYNPGAGAAGQMQDATGSLDLSATTVVSNDDDGSFSVVATGNAGSTAGSRLALHATSDARL